MKFAFLIIIAPIMAWSWDSTKCSNMLNNGLYKKYKWGGVGDHNLKAMTQETKKAGASSASSNISTEGSTALLDPKYYTNVTRSESQSTSSTGECSPFALKERKQQREAFIVQNLEHIKVESAQGGGPYLEALAWISMCNDSVSPLFNSTLKANFQNVFLGHDAVQALDKVVSDSVELRQGCYEFSSI